MYQSTSTHALLVDQYQLTPRLYAALERSANKHRHLCPRQVLGVRIAFTGADALGFEIPREDKKMLVIVETDGCFTSGIEAATGVGVNYRTMRVIDYGKIAATFVNVKTGEAIRVAPQPDVRQRAWMYAPVEDTRRYFTMLHGYQMMPDWELLTIERVTLTTPVKSLVSRPGVRAKCQRCGEEIINEREIIRDGVILCSPCAQPGYYTTSV